MATDTVEVRFAKIESRLTTIEERLGELHEDIADLRKDFRQLLYFVLGTWITTILVFVLAWINLSGQIAGLRPH